MEVGCGVNQQQATEGLMAGRVLFGGRTAVAVFSSIKMS